MQRRREKALQFARNTASNQYVGVVTIQATPSSLDISAVDSTPLDLRDDLFDVTSELNPVSASWKSIGIALRLNPNTLDSIQANNNNDSTACLTSVVKEWLKRNYNVERFGEPSWQWLVKAVGDPAGGANMALARDITWRHKAPSLLPQPTTISYYSSPSPSTLQPVQEPVQVQSAIPLHFHNLLETHSAVSTHQEATHENCANRHLINDKFADFQTKVCSKLFETGINTEEFRQFVKNQFPPGDCIPPPPANVKEIFKSITRHGLWNYFHYSPLVQIAKKFGANDPEMEGWVQTYKQDLKVHCLETTVEDYIEAELDVANPPPAKRMKNDFQYYCPMEWKTEFVDHSLQYLAEVWEKFSCQYLAPDSPPTALLDGIHGGYSSVTWHIPSSLVPTLIKRTRRSTDFYSLYRILKVIVGDQCVYEEVVEESDLALTDAQKQQVKNKLQARLEKVILEYFKLKNENVLSMGLKRFTNVTIHYEYLKHENSYFTVRISAKANDSIKILSAYETGPSGMLVGSGFGCAVGSVGGLIGMAFGTFLGGVVGSKMDGSKAREWDCTAEEIFRLLSPDGFEKRGGWVKCTVKLS